ncbi:MAG: HypC/HybG/HupF family hydrogenase formation chaperone [Bacteroidales bacterium]|nr:HypC/HybG/HupF family hydrogenase formation chaperone [Bacteroidales bacterium]
MCLAIPGKIEMINDSLKGLKMAKVNFGGLTKNICIEWVDVKVGDYVMAHAGVAISKVDTQEAENSLKRLDAILSDFNN